MKKEFTIILNRVQVIFLHRHISNIRDKAEAKLKQKEDTQTRVEFDTLTKLLINCKDLLVNGDENRLGIVRLREELEEALILCEEPEAVIEARKQLDSLPKEEDYRVTFDRETAKFTLKLLEKEIEWMRVHNIPGYEAKDPSEFTSKVLTKTYYINKAKKAKSILEDMKKKIETELV